MQNLKPYTCECSEVENPFCDGQCFSCILFYEDTRYCFVAGTPSISKEIIDTAIYSYKERLNQIENPLRNKPFKEEY